MQPGVGSTLVTLIVAYELARFFWTPQREVRSYEELIKADQGSGGKFSSAIRALAASRVDLSPAFNGNLDDFSAGFGKSPAREITEADLATLREVVAAAREVVAQAALNAA